MRDKANDGLVYRLWIKYVKRLSGVGQVRTGTAYSLTHSSSGLHILLLRSVTVAVVMFVWLRTSAPVELSSSLITPTRQHIKSHT